MIAEISTAQEDHEVASQTVQKSIAKTMPAVVEALSDLNSATSNKTKTSCFRDFRGAFKTAKKSIVPSDLTIQSSLCSAGDSLRNEQGKYCSLFVLITDFDFKALPMRST